MSIFQRIDSDLMSYTYSVMDNFVLGDINSEIGFFVQANLGFSRGIILIPN